MMIRTRPLALAFLSATLALASTSALADNAAARVTVPRAKGYSLAPVRSGAVSIHSPFETGDCSLCHRNKDAKNPGPAQKPVNKLCFSCHEEFQELMDKRRFKHAVAEQDCTTCHNPHNSVSKSLMVATAPQLCLDCHAGIQKVIDQKVKHGAIADGASCMNCHNAHASNVENLLSALPFDQCVQCHSKDGMVDNAGVKITNMKKLLDQNKAHHAPVAAKDCSACHEPHGSENFRLLVAAYPSAFYAPFDVKSYELCFGCHNDQLVTLPETLTATRFRDGNRNLHFLHVNKSDNGRTCRACHEVHASSQNYQIRESVPYGPRAYKLKVNFVKNDNGGNCTQTCHPGRTYTNSTVPAKKGK